MNITRKLAVSAAGMAAASTGLLGVGVALAPAAHAATSESCTTANANATITPGLTFNPPAGKVAANATFKASGCTGGTATAVAGSFKLTSTNLTCVSGSATGTFTAKVVAGTPLGNVSKGTVTLSATSTPLQFTLSGSVTSGYLAGSSVSGTFTATPKNGGNCQSVPLTKASITNNGPFSI